MAIGWVGNINTGNVQGQAQALAAAQAAATAAGTPADIAAVIAANPGGYGQFIPLLLSRFGPALTQNLLNVIGGAGGATTPPVNPRDMPVNLPSYGFPGTLPMPPEGGWGGPGGENPAYRGQGGGTAPGLRHYLTEPVTGPPTSGQPYVPLGGGAGAPGGLIGPNPGAPAATPAAPAPGQPPGMPAGWTPWGARGISFPQFYAQMRQGVQGALGAVAPPADMVNRQARLRAILGMGSAAAGVTSRLRG